MKGKPVSQDVQWIVVNMKAKGVPTNRIAEYTMISMRQVYRILAHYRGTGGVITRPGIETRGRAQKLLLSDIEVCC